MVKEEKVIREIKELIIDGYTPQSILYMYYHLFVEGLISYDDLRLYLQHIGYELSPELESMSLEEKKIKGLLY